MNAIQASCVQMFTWKFPILLFVLVAGVMRVDAQKSCTTSSSAIGQCVAPKRCSYITRQLQEFGSNVPPEFIESIKNSRCPDPANQEVLICCEEQFVQPLITAKTPPSVDVPDLGNQHINERGLDILKTIECGEVQHNVSRGHETQLNDFPFMALLKFDEIDQYQCGGALITNRFVISAPSCWVGRRTLPIAVRLGEHDYSNDMDCEKRGSNNYCNPPVEDYGIEKVITHPLYHRNKIHHNIGLIRLDRDVTFKVHIKPICMPIYEDSQILADDQMYLSAGWGVTENSAGKPTSVLHKVNVAHHPKEYCQNIFKVYTITDYHICAGGENNEGPCRGDSGGPLFFPTTYNKIPKYVQFGIVSHGTTACGEKSYPSIYTKIVPYLPWLTNEIAENEL